MQSQWSDKIAGSLRGLDSLVYTSRLIGGEPSLVLWGGGNSSAKVTAKDHTGRTVRLLWIKGSGSDMKTITSKQFTPLRLDELIILRERDDMTDEEMVAYQSSCVADPTSPKSSIETLLHAFLPPLHIYHTHADAICTLTNTCNSSRLIAAVYGKNVALIPYIRPGFRLAKMVAEAYRQNPALRAIILDKHGLVTWGNTPKAAYLTTIEMVTEAERFISRSAKMCTKRRKRTLQTLPTVMRRSLAADLAPVLRGIVSSNKRMVLAYDDRTLTLEFVNDRRARALSQIGPFTPDHMLHTKPTPLFVELPDVRDPKKSAQAVRSAIEKYRTEYVRYFNRYKTPGVTMLDPFPRVILIPQLGMFTTGKDCRATQITGDLYRHTMSVILASFMIDSYKSIAHKDMCDFEYWPMENYKLTLLPKDKPFSRRIALVTGAAGAIGRAIAARLVEEGAAVILTDINEEKIQFLSDELNQLSGGKNTSHVVMDVTDESSVATAFRKAVLAYGGLDVLVSSAGIAKSAPVDQITMHDWERCFAVNATGNFLVCREALRIMMQQRLGGSIVVVSTKNVLAPGKGFGAYSSSKAAQAQLARVLALEGADYGIRVNMVNPDSVLEGSGIWSKEIRTMRAMAYGIRVKDLEAHCIARTLLKTKVTASDVAETVLFLASDHSSKTTGAIIPVDGGAKEAFPR